MPRKGYRNVTLKDSTHARLQRLGEKESRSVPKQIEYMLNKLYPMEEATV